MLSGGQRQRINIARVAITARSLIPRCSTSALDTKSERAIRAAVDELQEKNAVPLVIAHVCRPLSRLMKFVVELKMGGSWERGTYLDLLESKGVTPSIA